MNFKVCSFLEDNQLACSKDVWKNSCQPRTHEGPGVASLDSVHIEIHHVNATFFKYLAMKLCDKSTFFHANQGIVPRRSFNMSDSLEQRTFREKDLRQLLIQCVQELIHVHRRRPRCFA